MINHNILFALALLMAVVSASVSFWPKGDVVINWKYEHVEGAKFRVSGEKVRGCLRLFEEFQAVALTPHGQVFTTIKFRTMRGNRDQGEQDFDIWYFKPVKNAVAYRLNFAHSCDTETVKGVTPWLYLEKTDG